jgi:hypothetical protein
MNALPTRTKRKIPTVAGVVADQKKQTEGSRALVTVPATAPVSWLDEGADRAIRFDGSLGKFYFADDKKTVDPAARFIARCDQVQIGRIRFHGKGEKPDQRTTTWFPEYRLPPREELGDTDPEKWEPGLDGKTPRDPWQELIEVPLQQNGDRFRFSTSSKTGIMASRILLRHFVKLRRKEPDAAVFPIVTLVPGGYKNSLGGWVHTPTFVIVGATARKDPSVPATVAEDLDDEIGF